jgi:hypothetical protein
MNGLGMIVLVHATLFTATGFGLMMRPLPGPASRTHS